MYKETAAAAAAAAAAAVNVQVSSSNSLHMYKEAAAAAADVDVQGSSSATTYLHHLLQLLLPLAHQATQPVAQARDQHAAPWPPRPASAAPTPPSGAEVAAAWRAISASMLASTLRISISRSDTSARSERSLGGQGREGRQHVCGGVGLAARGRLHTGRYVEGKVMGGLHTSKCVEGSIQASTNEKIEQIKIYMHTGI